MATTNLNPIYQFIQDSKPKPRTDEKERIKQNLRINALGQVFNLVAQGIGASKGATVIPTKDAYSPYAMNELSRMRMEELASDNQDRALTFKGLLNDQENARRDQWRAEDKEFRAGETDKRIRATADENAKFRMTPAQNADRVKQDFDYDMQKIFARAKLDKENKNSAKTESDKDLYPIPDGDYTYKLSEKALKSAWGYIMADPEMSAQIKSQNPGVFYQAKYEGADPDIGYMLTAVKALWPKLKSAYGGEPAETKPQTKQQKSNVITPDDKGVTDFTNLFSN